MSTQIWELHAIFKGRVQGVGFRWTVVDAAEKNGVAGTVKNLRNGTVEVFAQGSKESLEQLIKDLETNPGSARFSVSADYHQTQKKFDTFQILQ